LRKRAISPPLQLVSIRKVRPIAHPAC
jgi:hypothetical protein